MCRSKGFLPAGREQKRFFNLRGTRDIAGSDGGTFNMFPIDLSGKKWDSCSNPLRLEIELSTPTLTDVWYLGKSYPPDLHHPWLKG